MKKEVFEKGKREKNNQFLRKEKKRKMKEKNKTKQEMSIEINGKQLQKK